jgi:hypothetical protein
MNQRQMDLERPCLAAASLMGAALALAGCSGPPPAAPEPQERLAIDPVAAPDPDGTIEPIDKLPALAGGDPRQVLAELLAKPTVLGETTALHMRLPPPRDPKLADSLVRVLGPATSPQIVYRSDALAQLRVIPKSPGSDYFTAFGSLSPDELATLKRNQDEIASGVFGETTTESVVFAGRSPIGRTTNPTIDPNAFVIGMPATPVNLCPTMPASTQQAWDQALFVRDPAVVKDFNRTWDPCTGSGTPGGHWTFAHLMREMALGSSHTPEQFVTDWLSQWLNPYVVNGDIIPARPQMFTQVIQPWAIASGQSATLTVDPNTGRNVLSLSGPLDLNIAPLKLLAVVNRVDLGKTTTGGGYGGGGGIPTTPGELRFIFDVVQPNPWGAGTDATCGKKLFTVILEYGVPGTTCQAAVVWAKKWAALQAEPGFTPAYLALLDSMTESVVKHNAAPAKGNQNALNQIRTNEAALASQACGGPTGSPWELREFTLSNENPVTGTDLAASGFLRRHTVARTPDDATYSAGGPDPAITSFMAASTVTPTSTTTSCTLLPTYDVPFSFLGAPFRGGNSLMPPSFWKIASAGSHDMCARHQFSLNTCNGCHRGETGTNGLSGNTAFTHIDPLSPVPVTMSKFLTGGGLAMTYNVTDPQFGAPTVWRYADLQRRLQRLYELSHCTSCMQISTQSPAVIDRMRAFGPIPVDVAPGEVPFEVGPVTQLDTVAKLLDLRTAFSNPPTSTQVDFAVAAEAFSH